MTVLAGTTSIFGVGDVGSNTKSAGGLREDLEDIIWELDPMDTYLLSTLEKTKATATYHEWLKDSLVAAATNIQIEGDDFSGTSIVSPTRLGNYLQIVKKQFLVSGTLEASSKAGRKSELARQGMKQMKEFKRDVEKALIGNQASSGGGTGTGRAMGGMESWIASTDNSGNGVRATTTSSASTAAFASLLVSAPTDGSTTGVFTEANLKEALRLGWVAGGHDHTVIVGSTQKQALSAFAGVATKYNEIKGKSQGTIIGAADYYVSDYGNHEVVLSRYIRSSVVLCIDQDYWGVAWLRAPFMEEVAKTGDAEKRHIVGEMTLVARNPNSSAKVAACT